MRVSVREAIQRGLHRHDQQGAGVQLTINSIGYFQAGNITEATETSMCPGSFQFRALVRLRLAY